MEFDNTTLIFESPLLLLTVSRPNQTIVHADKNLDGGDKIWASQTPKYDTLSFIIKIKSSIRWWLDLELE